MLKIDLHTHAGKDANHSLDYSPKQLIDRMAGLGYDAVAITNHDTFTFSDKLRRYAGKRGILLIPGMERTIEGKEVILINIKKDAIEKIKRFADLEEYKKDNEDIFVIAPHSYYPSLRSLRSKLLRNIHLFDGIEFSHFYIRLITFNTRAARIAHEHNLPLIGTSDCHMFDQLNRTYTLVDAEKNVDSVLNALRKGKMRLVTEHIPFFKACKIILLMYFKY
ncbi:MAG: PHP domain-containing protein [Candidatus Woesearchaeota archaeon]|nr:PHP domain-containing protein [Candidatus Woesearchaeota archaeon]